MNEDPSLQKLDENIKKLINAETDNFLELGKLIGLNPLEHLAGANLQGTNLSNIDLSNADLTNADLTNADLTNTNLIRANLQGTNLTGTNLYNTRLGNNLGITEDLKVILEQKGAVFEGVSTRGDLSSNKTLMTWVKNNTQDFLKTIKNVNRLFDAVKLLESTLSGGEEEDLRRGATTIKRLKETKVFFGNPYGELILLTEEGLREKGVDLSYDIKQLMNRYDFYSMMMNVDIKPQSGVQISKLELELNFYPKGQYEPIIHKIFPETKWEKMLGAKMGMNLGLNADLDFEVGVDEKKLADVIKENSNLKANVSSKNSLKFEISTNDFNYKHGRFNRLATGENQSQCYWRFEEPEIKDQSSLEFFLIFKVPKGKKQIDLIGEVWVEPDINWLCANIGNLIENLPSSLKGWFANRKNLTKKFAVGKREIWNNLTLPKEKEKKLLWLF